MAYGSTSDICNVGIAVAWCEDADPGTKPLEAVRELWWELSESRWAV